MTELREPKVSVIISIEEVSRIDVPADELIIPCPCGEWMKYRNFSHVTYTFSGEKVVIDNLWAYRCSQCGLVAYPPGVADELDKQIRAERPNALHVA